MSDGAREENRFNLEAVDILIRSGLVNMAQYDMFLYQLMEQSRSLVAVQFAMQLVQRYCVEDKHNTLVTEVFHPILFYPNLCYSVLFSGNQLCSHLCRMYISIADHKSYNLLILTKDYKNFTTR